MLSKESENRAPTVALEPLRPLLIFLIAVVDFAGDKMKSSVSLLSQSQSRICSLPETADIQ
jgi:hypothetical protein